MFPFCLISRWKAPVAGARPVADMSLCPTLFLIHQTSTCIKPIEICTTLSNECQPLLVHHIPFCFRCQGSKGREGGICAFTIIIIIIICFGNSIREVFKVQDGFLSLVVRTSSSKRILWAGYEIRSAVWSFLVLGLDPVVFLKWCRVFGSV